MPAPGDTIGPYELQEELLRKPGGSTRAFRALDPRSGNVVAIEMPKDEATSVEKARFGVRARRLSGVANDGIFAVVDASGAPAHCALEAPEGDLLAAHAGVAIARARQKLVWLAQTASALAALHRAGVVHGRISLDAIRVLPDLAVKLEVRLDTDVAVTPLDDVRAFARAACELVLGPIAVGEVEATIKRRLHDAGLPLDAAHVFAQVAGGASMTSEDLAHRLSPHHELLGPTTEPLMPAMKRLT